MERPTVALIGCGAGAMCFLHALATRSKIDDPNLVLPYVTCFERADEPGGCWRSPPQEDRCQPHNAACWYDDVWSNVCKECFEFGDYTFEQHFQGKAVPTFLPRKLLLEYLVKRTTQVDPNLYQLEDEKQASSERLHEVRFRTTVTNVRFDRDRNQFEVGSAPFDPTAGPKDVPVATSVEHFDYCIWAGGLRGKPRIPRAILSLLRTGGEPVSDGSDSEPDSPPTPFTGTILHSIHAATQLEQAVKGKRVVIIGDANSAEDVTLQSIKHGAEKCYILSRSGYGDCIYMGSWPGIKDPSTGKIHSKVEVQAALPYRILDGGRSLKCAPMMWNHEHEVYEMDDDGISVVIRDVDTVILCTGYVPNMEFLSEDLKVHSEELSSWYWSAPPDFTMRPNAFTPDVGEVIPSKELSFSGNFVPGVYRTALIANPRMMYIMDIGSEFPILQLEARAWLSLAFITGKASIPSRHEMEEKLQEYMTEEMHVAYLRWSMDRNYFEALNVLGDSHWSDDYSDERTLEVNRQYFSHYAGVIVRDLQEADYPFDFGSYDNLNERGNQLVELGMQNVFMRHMLDSTSDESVWRTYRDVNPAPFRSIYTGQKAAPLPRRWLELDAEKVLET